MGRIEKVFRKLKHEGKKAFIPYIMAGDPTLDDTKKHVIDLETAGADIIELGVPFTDPLADGPTIQRASERALRRSVTLKRVLMLVREIRKSSEIPVILMTYYNPVFKFGIEVFVKKAVDAGVDGIIIPDLIPDEAGELLSASRKYGLDTIFLLAPTSTDERIKKVKRASTGFIYYVSITGITGAKLLMNGTMMETLRKIKSSTNKPVAVGFGVSSPEEASRVAALADGVIVGSAIVRLISQGKEIKTFAKTIRKVI